jgi:hypothetical protein
MIYMMGMIVTTVANRENFDAQVGRRTGSTSNLRQWKRKKITED